MRPLPPAIVRAAIESVCENNLKRNNRHQRNGLPSWFLR